MLKFLFLPLLFLSAGLYAQSGEMDAYSAKFFSGAQLGPQNFHAPSLEDTLVVKAYLFSIELLSLQFEGISTETLIKTQGEAIYGEMSNYASQYGSSTPGAPFLTLFGSLRAYLIPYRNKVAQSAFADAAKQDFQLALRKKPGYFPAYLALAQWYLTAPVELGGSAATSIEYLSKADSYAKEPFQSYQVRVLRAVAYKQQSNTNLSQKELDAARAIYPNGKMHSSYFPK